MVAFYLDNDVSLGLVPLLEHRGHTTQTARDLGLTTAGDDAQLLEAVQRQAILLTYNRKDFELLHDAWRTWAPALGLEMPPHPGILALAHAPVLEQIEAVDALSRGETIEALVNQMLFWSHGAGWRRRIIGQGWHPLT